MYKQLIKKNANFMQQIILYLNYERSWFIFIKNKYKAYSNLIAKSPFTTTIYTPISNWTDHRKIFYTIKYDNTFNNKMRKTCTDWIFFGRHIMTEILPLDHKMLNLTCASSIMISMAINFCFKIFYWGL